MVEQHGKEPAPKAPLLVRRGYAHLIDPQLGGLVGVHVVYRRGETDHHGAIQRDGKVVAWILEKPREAVGRGASQLVQRPIDFSQDSRDEYGCRRTRRALQLERRALWLPERLATGVREQAVEAAARCWRW